MGRIFISYRRQDSSSATGRLYDHLTEINGFDHDKIFRDIDQMSPGADFRQVIREALDETDIMLVVIGTQWANATDQQGRRRLDSPSDTHRLEIAAALHRDIYLIPVLVEGASHPVVDELPEDLADLSFRHAWELSDRKFANDSKRLAQELLKIQKRVEQQRLQKQIEEQERLDAKRKAADEADRVASGQVEEERTRRQKEREETAARIRREQAQADYYTTIKKEVESFPATTWLGVDPSDCVIFEDSPPGGRAALATGAVVVAGRQRTVDSRAIAWAAIGSIAAVILLLAPISTLYLAILLVAGVSAIIIASIWGMPPKKGRRGEPEGEGDAVDITEPDLDELLNDLLRYDSAEPGDGDGTDRDEDSNSVDITEPDFEEELAELLNDLLRYDSAEPGDGDGTDRDEDSNSVDDTDGAV